MVTRQPQIGGYRGQPAEPSTSQTTVIQSGYQATIEIEVNAERSATQDLVERQSLIDRGGPSGRVHGPGLSSVRPPLSDVLGEAPCSPCMLSGPVSGFTLPGLTSLFLDEGARTLERNMSSAASLPPKCYWLTTVRLVYCATNRPRPKRVKLRRAP